MIDFGLDRLLKEKLHVQEEGLVVVLRGGFGITEDSSR